MYLLFYLENGNKDDICLEVDICETIKDVKDMIEFYSPVNECDPMYERKNFRYIKFSKKDLRSFKYK